MSFSFHGGWKGANAAMLGEVWPRWSRIEPELAYFESFLLGALFASSDVN